MITLTPRYGRDYKSKAAVMADFDANKDFTVNDLTSRYNGKAANKADLKGTGTIKLRYNKLTKVFTHTV